jgi:hypothetical protein
VQSIEYLEFLVDDPPSTDGYTKMHILALLALVYEQSGPQYRIVLEKTYGDLQGELRSKDFFTCYDVVYRYLR